MVTEMDDSQQTKSSIEREPEIIPSVPRNDSNHPILNNGPPRFSIKAFSISTLVFIVCWPILFIAGSIVWLLGGLILGLSNGDGAPPALFSNKLFGLVTIALCQYILPTALSYLISLKLYKKLKMRWLGGSRT